MNDNRKNTFLYFVLFLLLAWMPFLISAWDKDKPSSPTSLRNSNPEILANWSALETALTQDHEFSTGGTNSGEHKQVKFNAPISTPTNAANKSFLYEKDVSSVVELHWLDESGNEFQMTSKGNWLANDAYFTATDNAGTGSVNLIKANTSDGMTFGVAVTADGVITNSEIPVFTKGTVANDAWVIARNAAGTGNVNLIKADSSDISVVRDGTETASNAAPAGDKSIANKKYVDDQISSNVPTGGTITANDSEANAMLKAHAYKAQTAGFAFARVTEQNVLISGFVHTTSDPAGAGTFLTGAGSSSTGESGMTLFVTKDQFFEITSSGTVTINWTSLISGGGAPIDQD